MKAVFDTRAGSIYDDDITSRYHFPNQYLEAAQQALGDWIVYREPRRNNGRNGYVAVARLARLAPDPASERHSYAYVEDYLPFDAVVPLQGAAGFYEDRLRAVARPSLRGFALHGKSIRTLRDDNTTHTAALSC